MWSIGCIAFELANRKRLFNGKDHVDQLQSMIEILGFPCLSAVHEICSPSWAFWVEGQPLPNDRPRLDLLFESWVEPELRDFIKALVQFNPINRLTAAQAIEFDYLTDMYGSDRVWNEEEEFGSELDLGRLDGGMALIRSMITEEVAACQFENLEE